MKETSRVPRPFLLYSATLSLAGVLALAYSWRAYPVVPTPQLALLLLAVLLSENFALSFPPFTASLSYPLAVAATVACGPAAGGLVAAAGAVNIEDLRSHKPPSVVLFNISQLVVISVLGGWIYLTLGGRLLLDSSGVWRPLTLADFPQVLLPMIALAAVSPAINLMNTALGISLLRKQRLRDLMPDVMGLFPTQFAFAFVGYLIAQVLAFSPLALVLFAAPLIVARQMYIRYVALRDAYVDTVRSFVGALEAKDPYTRGHSERVAGYAVELGKASGLDARACERLEYAALLHDLGKLAVPGSVLTKPASLTADELASIREHPGRGAEMMRRIPPLRDLADYVAKHHEWYGGGGYPLGVGASSIPELALILSVADCYDAMTTTRAYRGAFTREQAVAELIRGAGTQFDPEMVRLFIEAQVGLSVDRDAVESQREQAISAAAIEAK